MQTCLVSGWMVLQHHIHDYDLVWALLIISAFGLNWTDFFISALLKSQLTWGFSDFTTSRSKHRTSTCPTLVLSLNRQHRKYHLLRMHFTASGLAFWPYFHKLHKKSLTVSLTRLIEFYLHVLIIIMSEPLLRPTANSILWDYWKYGELKLYLSLTGFLSF